MRKLIVLWVSLALLVSAVPVLAQGDAGFVIDEATSVDDAVARVQQALEEQGLTVFGVIDHAANAASIGETLPPTQLILFGNPEAGTPLMQASRTIGLDLPQKFVVWQDATGEIRLAYNAPIEYLAVRHSIQGQDDLLERVNTVLSQFGGEALTMLPPGETEGLVLQDVTDMGSGLVVAGSSLPFDDTVTNLQNAIEGVGMVVPLVIDHAENAANAGLDLLPTTLIIFGNPEVGTPLMQAAPTIALDLPQKFLVWEDADGSVYITYNDPLYIAARHDLQGRDDLLLKIQDALENFVSPLAAPVG